jgi:hypothetical protein
MKRSPMFYQVIHKLKFLPEKNPKVPAVSSDKEVEGKITVRKGGGKKTDCLPVNPTQSKI